MNYFILLVAHQDINLIHPQIPPEGLKPSGLPITPNGLSQEEPETARSAVLGGSRESLLLHATSPTLSKGPTVREILSVSAQNLAHIAKARPSRHTSQAAPAQANGGGRGPQAPGRRRHPRPLALACRACPYQGCQEPGVSAWKALGVCSMYCSAPARKSTATRSSRQGRCQRSCLAR